MPFSMVYGPIAAWLVAMFPTRIRYTSMSLLYHIGNGWFGGFLPSVSFGIVALTGNIYRSEEPTSALQSLMRLSYAAFCLKQTSSQQEEQQAKRERRKGRHNNR